MLCMRAYIFATRDTADTDLQESNRATKFLVQIQKHPQRPIDGCKSIREILSLHVAVDCKVKWESVEKRLPVRGNPWLASLICP